MPAWLSKAVMPILIAAGLALFSALLVLQAVNGVSSWLETRRERIIAARDTYWKGEIAKANLETARTQAAQAQAVLRIETEAQAKLRSVDQQLADLEKKNAELPNGDACGLGRTRGQLLPK